MKRSFKIIFSLIVLSALAFPSAARERVLHVVTTGDVHGSWFDKSYMNGAPRVSLMSVEYYLDSLRNVAGAGNVLLLDAGDCLQGDNASYYYNYVDTLDEHLFTRLVSYMKYDAIIVGNHDIETGHHVYDRVYEELKSRGIPWLGSNAIRTDSGKPYFPTCRIFRKAGLKVAVLGFTNPNMKAWLSEPIWRGMDFVSLLPYVQQQVDAVRKADRPDVVIVVAHSGTGSGDGSVLEDQGLDLLNSLHGVDLVVAAHDHKPFVKEKDGVWLLDGGARAGYVGHAVIKADKTLCRIRSKSAVANIERMDKNKVDVDMEKAFAPDFEKVRAFTVQHVGNLAMTMKTHDALAGMSDYMNLLHTVQLGAPKAQISFAAPLNSNGTIKLGELVYNDMFTIYTYENQMFIVKMKGSEIVKYLEYSYNGWIQSPGDHVLKISQRTGNGQGGGRWYFDTPTYNFDSAGGLVYTVDVTKPYGSRVSVTSLSDGSPFDYDGWYNVAMTSYRANGGGDLIIKGAGLKKEEIDSRVVARYPEIREMIYQFIRKHDTIDSALIGDRSVIGEWHFVPEKVVKPLMDADMKLIF